MGLAGRYVGKALYLKPSREQDKTSTFVFEGASCSLSDIRVTYFTFGTP